MLPYQTLWINTCMLCPAFLVLVGPGGGGSKGIPDIVVTVVVVEGGGGILKTES